MSWTQHDKPGMPADSGWSDSRESRRQRVGAMHWSAVRAVRRSASLAACIIVCSLILQSARSRAEPLPEQLTRHNILDFLRDNDVTNVEDFIAALPDMHRTRNVLVFESGGLASEFVSGDRPRVVSWGADGRFVMSWGTDSESPFYEGVEFLEAARDRWVAGVIDFSGDQAEIREPAACSTCHGHLNKPLWGQFSMWRGTEGGEGHRVSPDAYRSVKRAFDSEDRRLSSLRFEYTVPVDLEDGEGLSRSLTFRDEVTNEVRDVTEVAREASSVFAWRHAEVLFGRIEGHDDYAAIARGMVCGDPSRFEAAVPLQDHHLAVLSDSGELLPGNYFVGGGVRSYWNGYGNLYESLRFLVLHDLFRRDTRVGRALAGREDRLRLAHRQHFSGVGRASLAARLRDPDGPVESGQTMGGVVASLAPLACNALDQEGGGLSGRAGHDVSVAGFTLVDAAGDRILGSVREGDAINLDAFAASQYTFRGDVAAPEHVGSVHFAVTGAAGALRRETLDTSPPYVLHGDDGAGDYFGESLPPGEYYLSATPYSTNGADGEAEPGVISTVRFVVEGSLPSPQVVSIGRGPGAVPEGSSAVFKLTRTGTATEELTVGVGVTESGSALSGTPPAAVTFAQGDARTMLTVPSTADKVVEGDSTVTAALTTGTGYVVGSASSASVTVEDDDEAAFTVTGEPEAIAEGESATLAVEIANGVTFAEDQTLALAVSGTASPADYTGVPAALTLAAGASSATAELAAKDDQEEEEAETLTVAVSHGGVSIGSATVTITSVSHDATLSALSLSGIDIGAFSGDTTAYAASVAHEISSTTVTAAASHARASVSISPGTEVSLAVGANEIAVTATAEDGSTTQTYTVTVTRAGPPLTGRFMSLPEAHSGLGTVVLRILFSEPLSTSFSSFWVGGGDTLQVTNGAVRGARPVDGRGDQWEITLAPSSVADMVVVLPPTVDCEIAEAVCTADGRPLSNRLEAVIPGPALPQVSIGAASSSVTEGASAAFTVTLGGAAAQALTVAVSVTEGGSMLSGVSPASVAFAAGDTSVTLNVPTEADKVVEADSPVTATVTAGTGYTVGTGSSASVTVEDDDAATFTVSAAPETIAEGESATLAVAIANGVTFAEDQTLALVSSGTASPADYQGVPATLTLAAGATSAKAELAAMDDDEEEEAETLTLTASHGGVPVGSATVTIRSVSHDATLSALGLSGIDIGAFSGDTTAYAASVAHGISSTTVTAAASHARASVSISPGTEVSLAVGANEITVTVTAEDGTTTKTYRVTVTRTGIPEASITAVSSPVTEGLAASFTVTLDEAAAEALTVSVSVTESGSVLSGAPPASVAFAKGETSATLRVPTEGDSVVEADSTVKATVTAGTGYTAGTASSASVTVEDDDAATFTVSADAEAIAEGESATLTVAISNAVTFPESQEVSLATSGTASASDYTGVPATLTLAAGASSATATLAASADQEEEEAETVTVTASHGGSAIGSATLTIHSVSHDATLGTLSLAGIEIGAFSGAVTSYQASVDHSVATTTVTATATHSAAKVSVEPGSEVNLAVGANEIAVTVTAEDGETTKTYTVTVTRAEERALPVVSVAAVEERVPGPIGEFTVSRTGPTAEPLEVQVLFATSRTPRDRTLTVRLLPGRSRVTRRVQGGDNRLVEDDITVTWTLQEGAGYTLSAEHASASLVLEESDIPEFSVSVEPAEIAEGESATVTVAISNGVRFRNAQTIALAVSGTASGSDYTGVPATLALRAYRTSATTATLTAAVDQEQEADETVTITASHGGSEIGSATLTIAAGEAPPLTARFAGMPEAHDGESAFSFRVAFSEDIGISFRALRGDAFTVTNGHVTRGVRVDDRRDLFEMTVQPDSRGAITITLEAGRNCAVSGAICTKGDNRRQLTNSPMATVAGPAAEPLTARFENVPEAHDGESAFSFRVAFSEDIGISFRALREDAFTMTNGHVTRGVRVDDRRDLFEITVQPDSDGDVTITLRAGRDCATSGAICTKGENRRRLTNSPSTTVKGPGSEASGEGFSLDPENSSPSGIWSDGETAWVADLADARLYAYSREDGERQPEKDIATEPSPRGLWSDGETLWAARLGGGLRAHRLADGARMPARDLSLEANAAPGGVWSDGETAWVSEWLGDTVHAYRLEDGRREAGRDIELADGNLMPAGLWSDGETLWVADWRERMFAYRLSDGGREPSLDVAAGAADTDPTGLWSGGGTLLSTSWDASEVRAYRLPALPALADAPGKGQEGFLRARAASLPPMADPALLAAINAALGKAAGESASAAELAGLETLEARNGGIRDLAGLEGATGLKELDLGFNPVADLRPLASLPALESLNLDGTAPDLPLLASLRGLERLSLRNTGIDDLQPLETLAGLTELDVGDNRIGDLSPLAALRGLTVLRADRNRIADLWPLASLSGLEVLELGSNRVRDLQPLAGLTQLRALRLEGNGLRALHPLAGLERLRDLGLAGNAVGSVGALADLGGLRRLDLRGNAVEDLRPLRALPSLVWLHVGGSRIRDLAPLDNLPGLTVAGRDDRDSPGVAGEVDARGSRQ